MKVGVVARADRGGLAQMTCEFVQAYRPYAALLVDLGANGRYATDRTRIEPYVDRLWVSDGAWNGDAYRFPVELDEFFYDCDVVYAAETVYDRRAYAICRAARTGLVLHAMPELCAAVDIAHAPTVWLPTAWERDRIDERRSAAGRSPSVEVPVPIALDGWDYRQRTTAQVFAAIGGEAFHDRNGLRLVYEALPYVERPSLLYVRGGPRPDQERWTEGRVTVQWLDACDDYHVAIPPDTDVLLMPRRYAGLSLPIREAAAQGVIPIMSDLPPQRGWTGVPSMFRIPMDTSYPVEMKGGQFDVWQTDPRNVAAAWNDLADLPDHRAADLSRRAREWAETLSWDSCRGLYDAEFARAAETARA